jgi:hypothetical protein
VRIWFDLAGRCGAVRGPRAKANLNLASVFCVHGPDLSTEWWVRFCERKVYMTTSRAPLVIRDPT